MSTLVQNPDYAEEGEHQPLQFKLYDKWDDEDDLWIKHRLEALVNQQITPEQLALDMDHRITALTRRNRNDGIEPQRAEQFIGPFFQALTKMCSVFPPYHPGQNQLIALVKALNALPRHVIPEGLSPAQLEEKPWITTTLWSFDDSYQEGNWKSCAEAFNFEHVYVLAPYRIRNYDSAMARLTCAGLIDCAFLSSLRFILPTDEYPDLTKRPIDGPNKLGNYLVGAAQWILGPKECRYAYTECQKVERVDVRQRELWSRENWAEWKRQFAFVAGDERFVQKYRSVAAQAHHQMITCEKEEELRQDV
ncbi:uncharacterized protein BO66DRAFT_470695 [Aspergillus aculeatinus CBS 121060]|uniref:Uncharacterized protein n=1 Tax=Aspergillus aculeatinus CBS 121060 TaxID=1448322 RepID=A0ACD1HCB5_9EURO|nr:hypothetical protein BO66DRAFT_470695 [Aspergillus aculeatinus CBS 121060]RAH71179.1 hypothetical protein BO66DRAFT_470695 [Aspergillus aculeatinus CBS 121060]